MQQNPVHALDGASACQLTQYGNDLQAPACRLMPEIADLLTILASQDGADAVGGMSGSGATCFAIYSFADRLYAAVSELLAKKHLGGCNEDYLASFSLL